MRLAALPFACVPWLFRIGCSLHFFDLFCLFLLVDFLSPPSDHYDTALAIAKQIGIFSEENGDRAMNGDALAVLTEEQLGQCNTHARASTSTGSRPTMV